MNIQLFRVSQISQELPERPLKWAPGQPLGWRMLTSGIPQRLPECASRKHALMHFSWCWHRLKLSQGIIKLWDRETIRTSTKSQSTTLFFAPLNLTLEGTKLHKRSFCHLFWCFTKAYSMSLTPASCEGPFGAVMLALFPSWLASDDRWDGMTLWVLERGLLNHAHLGMGQNPGT